MRLTAFHKRLFRKNIRGEKRKNMVTTLSTDELKGYLARQLEIFFPDGTTDKYFKGSDVDFALQLALERLENCFKHINYKGYSDDNGQTYFSHLHSDQYSHFLYYFMNSLWEESANKVICDKVLLLNKFLNNIFVSYKCKLPDIFLIDHPIGTVLGNAEYSDYLCVLQNVTVNTGESADGSLAPKLGKGLFLCAGAKIIGNETIGDRVTLGVDAVVYKRAIGNDKLVIRDAEGKIRIKDSTKCIAQMVFRTTIK